jgi:glutamine amidotransferase
MCELMGLSFERPVSADFSIRAFACRDRDNPDGWGLAWYPDRSACIVKEAVTMTGSAYSKFLESWPGLKARLYLAHVRKQTTGGPVTHADTHPFSRECLGREFCFAHNGTILNFATLALSRYSPIGSTDSERLFCHLLERMLARRKLLEEPADWHWLWQTLSELNDHGTINCLMSDGQRLFGYRDRKGWKGLAVRKVRLHGERRTFEDAVTGVSVDGGADNRGCMLATAPLTETGWHPLTLGSLVVLEGGSIRYSSDNPEHARSA